MRETPNSYMSVWLVMVGIHALTIHRNSLILSLRRTLLSKSETLLRPNRKSTHVHLRLEHILRLYVHLSNILNSRTLGRRIIIT